MPSWLWIGASAFLLANLALIPLEVVAIVAGVMLIVTRWSPRPVRHTTTCPADGPP